MRGREKVKKQEGRGSGKWRSEWRDSIRKGAKGGGREEEKFFHFEGELIQEERMVGWGASIWIEKEHPE